MKHTIEEQYGGYIVRTAHARWQSRLYVKSIYKGKPNYSTDYTYAKVYSKQTASRIADQLSR